MTYYYVFCLCFSEYSYIRLLDRRKRIWCCNAAAMQVNDLLQCRLMRLVISANVRKRYIINNITWLVTRLMSITVKQ